MGLTGHDRQRARRARRRGGRDHERTSIHCSPLEPVAEHRACASHVSSGRIGHDRRVAHMPSH
ncbi:hypothetical protein SLI_7389 [Streptomyces lividans 1326]|uniref:Uncharacterized protein n=1 Tax=Streptomyces lividans 1326 TaxID=1200984 RepID=A0A7U9HEQ3_STRLI|nr:hypothetical protein SLI_7389 [Streptomyces lividans 1326]